MAVFSRELRKRDLVQVAAGTLGFAWLVLLAAYAYSALSVTPTIGALVAALAALLIAGAGILYAWREPGR
ncbi:MAG: hypothetical protein E6H86_05755 [Chloroflexi bacterium]|nr:MAG: hypothetical protein E6H86_05755 [Chloroflexota bacterium]